MCGWRMAVLTAAVLLAMFGCAGGPAEPPPPEPVNASIIASDRLNPRTDGSPQRVDLMIFQLGAVETFNDASFFDLYPQASKARQTLGLDLLDVRKRQIAPGTEERVVLEVDDKARFIGVLAAFEQLDRAIWRANVEIRDETLADKVLFRSRAITIALDDMTVDVAFE